MSTPSSATPTRKQTRTRSGCLNCRRRKRKCDEARPTCSTCRRRGQACEWGVVLTFRDENAQGLDGCHPSMREMGKRAWRRPIRELRILDVTTEVIRDYHAEEDGLFLGQGNDANVDDDTERPNSVQTIETPPSNLSTAQKQTECAVEHLLYLRQGGHQPSQTMSGLTGFPETPPSTLPQHQLESLSADLPIDMSTDYSYLDIIQDNRVFTPDGVISEDGIFRPGTAYHELHSTLRHHLIQEVRSNVPTRPTTPGFERQGSEEIDGPATNTIDDGNNSDCTPDTAVASFAVSDAAPLLSGPDECDLWRNWFDEVSHWLDKFDRDRHFQTILPAMARDHAYLRYSILALSARQRELKQTTRPTDRSLALYQEAIHQLLPHLPSRSTAVISTCVILCVLEMVSCSPRDWRRHLDGCASLMQAVGINGFVGGIEQALFWCFARMDICGGLISSITTLIPVSRWTGKTTVLSSDISADIDADVALFHAATARVGFEHWANYSVYLLGRVMDLIYGETAALVARASLKSRAPIGTDTPTYRARWQQLWQHVSDWYRDRPPALHPTMTVPSSTDTTATFPTILFSNPAGISGNQLYHTASILLLQNQPIGLRLSMPGRPKPRGILWHARQICGIAISNHHHGAWTNTIQPLWIAGRCMSHPSEHKAILELMERIERESGWGTRTRADDLREFWGDLDD